MAYIHLFFLIASLLLTIPSSSSASRNLLNSDPSTTTNYQLLEYHKGPLLTGPVRVNLIWYGKFTPRQRSIVADFVTSLSSSSSSKPVEHQPSVATWWDAIDKYYHLAQSSSHNNKINKKHLRQQKPLALSLGSQILDQDYSLGKSLTTAHIEQLAAKGTQSYAVNVVLTASDVTVDGFCMSRCGYHGAAKGSSSSSSKKRPTFAYIWVGNSETQCPGQCAWPFHQPIYGPQTPPLVSPNNDVAIDGIIINLATLMAGTATNPFGTGYFQGPKEAPLEAASACPGVYGKGAYPGFPGQLLVDRTSGASYNAQGVNGRKYLLPALFDPSTSKCSTLV